MGTSLAARTPARTQGMTAARNARISGISRTTFYVRALLPRLAAKANIEKRVHAHGLRHTHAAELALEGVPMHVIQAQLGHSNLGTTSRYLAHIAPTEVIAAMQLREWEV